MFNKYGVELFDIQEINIHGGTVLFFIGHIGEYEVNHIGYQMVVKEEKNCLFIKLVVICEHSFKISAS